MARNDLLYLVTGATGTQGGATARALLAAGHRVRILTRNPDAAPAIALTQRGAEVAKGDMGEPDSLAAAMRDVHGVFSMQRPDVDGTDSERRHGFALVDAARKAGVRHVVHASVCQSGQHASFPRWDDGYWSQKYWTDKWDVEQAVREAGFAHWTVLKPAFMMENFAEPKAKILFPHLRQGRIITPVRPDTRLQLIAGDDIGAIAQAAFASPSRFDRECIDLAGDTLTMSEVAAVLGKALRRTVVLQSVSPAEAQQAGIFASWVRAQEWINEVGYRVDIAALAAYGIPLTSFAAWVQRHAGEIVVEN